MDYVMSENSENDSTTVQGSTDLVQKVPDDKDSYIDESTVKDGNSLNIIHKEGESSNENKSNMFSQQDDLMNKQEPTNHEEIPIETEKMICSENDSALKNCSRQHVRIRLPSGDIPYNDDIEEDKLSMSSSDDDGDDLLNLIIDRIGAESGDSDIENNNPKTNQKSACKKPINLEEITPTKDVSGITATEAADLKLVGHFKHPVIEANIVLIESVEGMPGLNLETILFRKDRTAFGEISEVIGPVVRPFYVIKFSSADEIAEKQIQDREEFFYIPNHTEWTRFIFTEELNRNRGTDASWIGDEEAPDEVKEYSDDEEEKKAKKKTTTQKDDPPSTSWPPPRKMAVPNRQKKAQQNTQQFQGSSDFQAPHNNQTYPYPPTNGPVSHIPMGTSFGPMGGQQGPMGGPQGFMCGPYGPMGGPQEFVGGPYWPMGGPQGPTNRHMMYPPNSLYTHQPGQPCNDPSFMASHGGPMGGPHFQGNRPFPPPNNFYGLQHQGYFGQPGFHNPHGVNPYHSQMDPRHCHGPPGRYY